MSQHQALMGDMSEVVPMPPGGWTDPAKEAGTEHREGRTSAAAVRAAAAHRRRSRRRKEREKQARISTVIPTTPIHAREPLFITRPRNQDAIPRSRHKLPKIGGVGLGLGHGHAESGQKTTHTDYLSKAPMRLSETRSPRISGHIDPFYRSEYVQYDVPPQTAPSHSGRISASGQSRKNRSSTVHEMVAGRADHFRKLSNEHGGKRHYKEPKSSHSAALVLQDSLVSATQRIQALEERLTSFKVRPRAATPPGRADVATDPMISPSVLERSLTEQRARAELLHNEITATRNAILKKSHSRYSFPRKTPSDSTLPQLFARFCAATARDRDNSDRVTRSIVRERDHLRNQLKSTVRDLYEAQAEIHAIAEKRLKTISESDTLTARLRNEQEAVANMKKAAAEWNIQRINFEHQVKELKERAASAESLLQERETQLKKQEDDFKIEQAVFERSLASLHRDRVEYTAKAQKEALELKANVSSKDSLLEQERHENQDLRKKLRETEALAEKLSLVCDQLRSERDAQARSVSRLIPEKEDQQYEAAKAKVEIDHLNSKNEKLKSKMRELERRLAVRRPEDEEELLAPTADIPESALAKFIESKSSRVAVLVARIKELQASHASQLATAREQHNHTLDEKVTYFHNRIEELERDHELASGSVSRQHKRKLGKRDIAMHALRVSNKSLAEKNGVLSASFESISARFEEIAALHETSEGNVKALTAERDQLRAECSQLSERLEALSSRFDFICGEHASLESHLEIVTCERNELAVLQSAAQERFDTLTSRFEFLSDSHTDMESDVAKIQSERNRLFEERNMLQDQFDTLASRHDYLIEAQNTVESQLEKVSADRNRLQRETGAMRERFETLSARFSYLCEASTNLESDLSASHKDVLRQRKRSAKFKDTADRFRKEADELKLNFNVARFSPEYFRDDDESETSDNSYYVSSEDEPSYLETADHAARTIQYGYRDYQRRMEENDIREYHEERERAAASIQSGFRGHEARREATRRKRERDCATTIQALVRGHQAREKTSAMRTERNAAISIQCGHRSHKARIEVSKRRLEKAAATTIQSGFRGYKVRHEFSTLRASVLSLQAFVRGSIDRIVISQLLDLMAQHESAAKIQAVYRGFSDRKALKQIEVLHEHATKIQANVRGFIQRKRLSLEKESATRIQAGVRGYKCRKAIKQRHENATTIQAAFRGYNSRKHVKEVQQISATIALQSALRGSSSRQDTRTQSAARSIQSALRAQSARTEIKLRSAALSLQSALRGQSARSDTKQRSAVVSLQSTFRGAMDRKKVEQTSADKKLEIPTLALQSIERGQETSTQLTDRYTERVDSLSRDFVSPLAIDSARELGVVAPRTAEEIEAQARDIASDLLSSVEDSVIGFCRKIGSVIEDQDQASEQINAQHVEDCTEAEVLPQERLRQATATAVSRDLVEALEGSIMSQFGVEISDDSVEHVDPEEHKDGRPDQALLRQATASVISKELVASLQESIISAFEDSTSSDSESVLSESLDDDALRTIAQSVAAEFVNSLDKSVLDMMSGYGLREESDIVASLEEQALVIAKEFVSHLEELILTQLFGSTQCDDELAATKIQAAFRGHRARERVDALRSKRTALENRSAVAIQASYRGHRTRCQRTRVEESAVKIQATFRGHRARCQRTREDESAKREDESAKREDESAKREDESAAVKIQATFRGHQARARSKANDLRRAEERQECAAVKIQATFRGYKTRSNLSALQELARSIAHTFVLPLEDVSLFGVPIPQESENSPRRDADVIDALSENVRALIRNQTSDVVEASILRVCGQSQP